MPDLPSVSGKKAVKAFGILSVPVHGNRDLPLGTLRGLIVAAGVTEAAFVAEL